MAKKEKEEEQLSPQEQRMKALQAGLIGRVQRVFFGRRRQRREHRAEFLGKRRLHVCVAAVPPPEKRRIVGPVDLSCIGDALHELPAF